jgi:hypothetical protein
MYDHSTWGREARGGEVDLCLGGLGDDLKLPREGVRVQGGKRARGQCEKGVEM